MYIYVGWRYIREICVLIILWNKSRTTVTSEGGNEVANRQGQFTVVSCSWNSRVLITPSVMGCSIFLVQLACC